MRKICLAMHARAQYAFHYFPVNGSLKTDFGIEDFTPKNETSCLFIEFSMRYTSEKSETVNVVTNQEKLEVTSLSDQHKINSTTIFLTSNNHFRGFFDFGGRLEIDNITTTPIGAVVPWIERGYQHFPPMYDYSVAVGIQLSYPHVNKTLSHDPSFGLRTSYETLPSYTPPGGEPSKSTEHNGETPWKVPLIATAIALATITVTTIILRRKRRLPKTNPLNHNIPFFLTCTCLRTEKKWGTGDIHLTIGFEENIALRGQ